MGFKNKVFSYIAVLAGALMLQACALQTGLPGGGPEDYTPPEALAFEPANGTVSFDASAVEIQFNEFIVLSNPLQEIIISPAMDVPPSFYVKKKSLIIDLSKSTLKENTTYTIQFANAIKDNNRGNVLKGFQYIFSTGDYLDSLSISGKVEDALSVTPASGYKVMLHGLQGDSAVMKERPLFYTLTQENGSFVLNNLPPGQYRLYAINDKNSNHTLESGEEVAFWDTIIDLRAAYTLSKPLRSFTSDLKDLVIESYRISADKFVLGFNKPVDSIQVWRNEKRQELITNLFLPPDPVVAWPKQRYDSIAPLHVKAYSGLEGMDTLITPGKGDTLLSSMFYATAEQSQNYLNEYGTMLLVRFSAPLKRFDPANFKLYADSIEVPYSKIEFTDSTHTVLAFHADYQADVQNKAVLPAEAFRSIYGDTLRDTIYTSFIREPATNHAFMEVNVVPKDEQQSVFQVITSDGKVFYSKVLTSAQKITLPYVKPDTYRMRMIEDRNRNGRWDRGDVLRGKQPEKVVYYPDNVTVKANWELLDIKFEAPGNQ